MNINATLLGQMIAFLLFVWFTKKFVWPPIMQAMQERSKRIADGLAAADQGKKELVDAEGRAKEIVSEARQNAVGIVDQAQLRAGESIEAAKSIGTREGERMIQAARDEIEQVSNRARDELRKEVAAIALAGAGKLLEREIDAKTHKQLLDKLAAEI
ncbi:MAG: F0F1 ATP synthase subunit B [Gammaproteobacteria bacterium]